MRRTQQEFKAEVFRRSSAYKARRKKRIRRTLLSVGCAALVVFALPFLMVLSFGGMGGSNESAAIMQDAVTAQTPESVLEAPQEPATGTNGAPIYREENGKVTTEYSFSVSKVGTGVVNTLQTEDAEKILEILSKAKWDFTNHRCYRDYEITLAEKIYAYSTGCEMFYDVETGEHAALTEDEQAMLHEILEKYITEGAAE